ncbi:MAG: GYD domain-containing protein [candidate division NC10 bacterium]|nr:GYD domain-containing protein [candidate division NC10 bacterium]MDE2322252.1 GYD domain-containing protein [candidate division NC10 bacterium]
MKFVTLAKVKPGAWSKLAHDLPAACYEGMKSAYVTYGQYDVVFEWEAKDMDTANSIMKHMAGSGLITSETLVVASTLKEFDQK